MDLWVWSVVLFLIALAIIAVEMFVPSGGLLGVMAALAVLGSLVLAYMTSWGFGMVMTAVVLVVIPVVIASALKWWPHTPIGRLILNTPPETPDDVLPDTDPRYALRNLVGTLAVARTKMLPSGIVQIGDRVYDAVGDGQAIEPGQVVRVIGVDLNRLEVRLEEAVLPVRSTPTKVRDLPAGDDILARPLEALGLEPIEIKASDLLPRGEADTAGGSREPENAPLGHAAGRAVSIPANPS